jgi:hypothetical protein
MSPPARAFRCADNRLLATSDTVRLLLRRHGAALRRADEAVTQRRLEDLVRAACAPQGGLDRSRPWAPARYPSARAEEAAVARLNALHELIVLAQRAGRSALGRDAESAFDRVWCDLEHYATYHLDVGDEDAVQRADEVEHLSWGDVRHVLGRGELGATLERLSCFRRVVSLEMQMNDLTLEELSAVDFSAFHRLRALSLEGNRLVTIPSSVCASESIEVLDLCRNRIGSIPDLSRMTRLRRLLLAENPLPKAELARAVERCPDVELVFRESFGSMMARLLTEEQARRKADAD